MCFASMRTWVQYPEHIFKTNNNDDKHTKPAIHGCANLQYQFPEYCWSLILVHLASYLETPYHHWHQKVNSSWKMTSEVDLMYMYTYRHRQSSTWLHMYIQRGKQRQWWPHMHIHREASRDNGALCLHTQRYIEK